MRVAICVVFFSIFTVAGSAGARAAVDRPTSYPTSETPRNVTASQDAIGPSALQQRRATATPEASNAAGVDFAGAPVAADANFDRRLASLDPSQIVYGSRQSQAQVPAAQASLLDLGDGRLFPRQEQRQPPRRQHARSAGDFMLMGFAALMLIAYQLHKKHRFLRPHPFSY